MAIQPFSWGASGQKASPSSVKRQAEIAAALAARGGAPQNLGEGLNRIGEALLANSYNARAAAGEEEGAASRQALMDALMGNPDPTMADIAGALGNEWVASDPGSSAVLQALLGAEIQQNDPLRQLQIEKGQFELDALRNPPPAEPDYGFTFAPDGTLIRTDTTSGTFDPMGSYPKPEEGPLVNIVNGDGAPGLGKLSPDFGYVLDPETRQPVIDPATGLPTAAPVPGSPAALEAAAAAAAAELSDERSDLKGSVVVQDIDRALQSITENPGLTTGIGSAITGGVPSSPAYNVNALIDTVKANAGFAELQAMRESSPTGGALGNVTEKEIAYLQATIGNLDPRQSPEQLQDNLRRVKNAYLDIIHGEGKGPAREPLSFEGDGGAPKFDYNAETAPEGWGGDPALWRFMSPEDRALW